MIRNSECREDIDLTAGLNISRQHHPVSSLNHTVAVRFTLSQRKINRA